MYSITYYYFSLLIFFQVNEYIVLAQLQVTEFTYILSQLTTIIALPCL